MLYYKWILSIDITKDKNNLLNLCKTTNKNDLTEK